MNTVRELITKWRDEADSNDHESQLRRCADELEEALGPAPVRSIFYETVLHSQKEIKSALDFHRTVLLYFTDSPIPARVMDVTQGDKAAVRVQHGGHFFWVRIGKSSVDRIVLHEMKLTTI